MHYGTYFWAGEQRYKFCFPAGDASSSPVWGEDEFPPLSPRQAERSATLFLESHLPGSFGRLNSYKLNRTWGPKENDCYWYYSIEFMVPDPEDIGADASLVEIPVLFDGTVPPLVDSPVGTSS